MDNNIIITSPCDQRVFIRVTQGHFVTENAHINYYVGTSDIKHNHAVSVDAAMLMAQYYIERDIKIDTVLCLYETQALGAYIAHELSRPSMLQPNPKGEIYVLGPEYDAAGNMIFRDNLQRMIHGRRVLILISCITSGKTVQRAMESVAYYGGRTVGVSAAFSAAREIGGVEISSIFTQNDLPDYKVFSKHDCPLCRQGEPVKGIANGHGYSTLP